MSDYVAIKIKIFQNPDGSMDHPKFRDSLSIFIGTPNYKSGRIYYDQTSDCQTDSIHSPSGERWALKLVETAFAEQAIAAFPDRVFKMTDSEVEDFWNNRAHANVSENRVDGDILRGLSDELHLREALGETGVSLAPVKAKIAKALDPNDVEPGIRKDPTKKWIDAKVHLGITLVALTIK